MIDTIIIATAEEMAKLMIEGEVSLDAKGVDLFTFFTILADHYGYVPATNDVY
jgi:hypothetical protein